MLLTLLSTFNTRPAYCTSVSQKTSLGLICLYLSRMPCNARRSVRRCQNLGSKRKRQTHTRTHIRRRRRENRTNTCSGQIDDDGCNRVSNNSCARRPSDFYTTKNTGDAPATRSPIPTPFTLIAAAIPLTILLSCLNE